jgi:hypothetical protein
MEAGATASLQTVPGTRDVAVRVVHRGRCEREGVAQVALGSVLDHEVRVLVDLGTRLAVLDVHGKIVGNTIRQEMRSGRVGVASQWRVCRRQLVGDRGAGHLLINIDDASGGTTGFAWVSRTRCGASSRGYGLGVWRRKTQATNGSIFQTDDVVASVYGLSFAHLDVHADVGNIRDKEWQSGTLVEITSKTGPGRGLPVHRSSHEHDGYEGVMATGPEGR